MTTPDNTLNPWGDIQHLFLAFLAYFDFSTQIFQRENVLPTILADSAKVKVNQALSSFFGGKKFHFTLYFAKAIVLLCI